MKKNYAICLSIIIIVIISLILIICLKGNNKSKKDNKESKSSQNMEIENKYIVDDVIIGNLKIENISVEMFDDYTLISFEIKNNSAEVYPEGHIRFSIEDSNVVLETVSSFVSTIEPNSSINIELVLNDVYSNIDAIKIVE